MARKNSNNLRVSYIGEEALFRTHQARNPILAARHPTWKGSNGMNTRPRYLDKYELRELLGRGGMAEVWKAYDSQLQRFVAVKLLHTDQQNDPGFLNRFVREAQVIASLKHSNIVQVYDFQTANVLDGTSPIPYMVMEYIEGQTLA